MSNKAELGRRRDERIARGVCGIRGNVMRFLPPPTIPDAPLDEALGIARELVAGLHRRAGHQ